jgi:hypothetical protein
LNESNPVEADKMAFDNLKHLATLSSGSIVIIGTFLSDIFPKKTDGTLAVSSDVPRYIEGAFLCFGVCLVACVVFMFMEAYAMRHEDKDSLLKDWRVTIVTGTTSFLPFLLGLALFGAAVLLGVFMPTGN